MKQASGIAVFVGLSLALAATLRADTLTTRDGRTFQGRLVSQDASQVVFEIHQYGAVVTKTFPKADVSSITEGALAPKTRPARSPAPDPDALKLPPEPEPPPIVKYDGPTYYLIPVEGIIGMQVTGTYLERCLADAAARSPSVVILVVDSPGGLVSSVDKLVDAIHKYNDKVRVAVYVRKAISAAAIVSLAGREIYLEPKAVFGAATAFQMSPFALPGAIAEKFQSVWRARARSAAEIGGHSPLLAEAMIDSSMELHIVKDPDGTVRIASGRGRRMLTDKGKLLTLTAGEAVEAGLARDIAEDLNQLGEKLGFPGWVECKGHGTLLAEYWKKSLADYIKQSQELTADFYRNMTKAAENRPERPKIPYRYYQRTGTFAPESRRRWQNRSRECIRWLMKAEANMKQMAERSERLDELKAGAEHYRRLQKEVEKIRLEVVRNLHKRGPDG